MLGRHLALGAVVIAILAVAQTSAPGDEPLATLIAIDNCDTGLCGRIIGLGNLPKLVPCAFCEQRVEPREQLCGRLVAAALQPSQTGWRGVFADPRSGDAYTLDLAWSKSAPGTTLLTRRYHEEPFFSRSVPRVVAWTRVVPPAEPCGAAAPAS